VWAGATAIRRVVVWFRDGSRFEGWASNDGLGSLQFVGEGPLFSIWHRVTGAEVADAILSDAPPAYVRLLKADASETEYGRGDDGKWRRGWRSQQSTKQLAGSLRRSKAIRFAVLGAVR
jgi:hypothetical protein